MKKIYNCLGIEICLARFMNCLLPEERVILTPEQKRMKIENWMR